MFRASWSRATGSVLSKDLSCFCANVDPEPVCASATRSLASTSPLRTAPMRNTPRSATTTADTRSVVVTTRNWRERRHRRATSCQPRCTRIVVTAPRRSRGASLVAHAAHGDDDLRMLGVAFDLRAQPLDVNVDEAGVGGVPVAPHLLEERLA